MKWYTCTTETKEIPDPVSVGGIDSVDFGLAEYAAGEAERTFSTCSIRQPCVIYQFGNSYTSRHLCLSDVESYQVACRIYRVTNSLKKYRSLQWSCKRKKIHINTRWMFG